MAGTMVDPGLHTRLARWVDEGLIDSGQATRIEAVEAARTPAPRASGGILAGRAPLVVEALGYLGGALAIIAGFVAVTELWPDIPTGAQLAFAGAAAVVLGGTGVLVRTGGDPAFGRLRSVLWTLSVAGFAAFAGILAAQVWEFGPLSTALLASGTAAGYAALLWWRVAAPLQLLTLFVAAASAVGTGIARADTDLEVWAPGLGVWAFSALWAVAVYRGYLRPATVGYVAAAAGMLFGAQLTMQEAAGHVLALGTVAGLLAAGVALRKVWLLAIGAIGVVQVVPTSAVRYLPPAVGAPLAIFAVGLALLAVALWLALRSKRGK